VWEFWQVLDRNFDPGKSPPLKTEKSSILLTI
jgi:hypothetical protein